MEMKQLLNESMQKGGNGIRRGFFSLVYENYHNLSKEELRDIIKELDYIICNKTSVERYNKIIEETVNELMELYED